MSVALSPDEHIMRVRADFRMGAGVVLCRGDSRWLVASAETVSPARFAAMQGFGAVELVITNRRAKTLQTPTGFDNLVRLHVPDNRGLDWVHSVADPQDDQTHPLTEPFEQVESQQSDPHRAALAICKMAQLLPAVLGVEITSDQAGDLHCIELDLLLDALEKGSSPLQKVADAPLPLAVSKDAKLHVFRHADGGQEHYAIQIGDPDLSQPVLVRLHSACFTGDVIGSLKCDCGAQLNSALTLMGQRGAGILLYLDQEGRGIGLANKMRAYTVQTQGYDTVEANHRLGFEDDERNFRLGAEILKILGVGSVDLLTNNPAKVDQMMQAGIGVNQRVALVVGKNPFNAAYLATKAAKSGHIL